MSDVRWTVTFKHWRHRREMPGEWRERGQRGFASMGAAENFRDMLAQWAGVANDRLLIKAIIDDVEPYGG